MYCPCSVGKKRCIFRKRQSMNRSIYLVPQQGATLKEESQAWPSELTVCLSCRESSCHGFDSHGWHKIHRSNVHVMVLHPGTVGLTKQSYLLRLN